jgi:transposase
MVEKTGGQKSRQLFLNTVKSPNSMERSIIQPHQMRFSRSKIAEILQVGHGRIDDIVHEWESTGQRQDAKPRGRP